MFLRRTVSLCLILFLICASAVFPVYATGDSETNEASDIPPLSLSGTARDTMCFLPGNRYLPADNSVKQIYFVLPGEAYGSNDTSLKIYPVDVTVPMCTESVSTESISPRAP